MTRDDFRRIALSLPGAVEGAHMGHPDFRANGRIFASLHAGDASGMIKVTPDEQAALTCEHPAAFAPSAGAWGRQGCTNVHLGNARATVVRAAMLLAFEAAMAKPRPRPRARRPPGRSSGG